jgi:hypothetical protein
MMAKRYAMRSARGLLIGSALVCALCLAAPASARVAAQAPQPQRTFATAEECMGSAAELGIVGSPTCTRAGNGLWVATYEEDPGFTGIPESRSSSGAFGAFLLFALLWAATPAVIAGAVASSRQQSVGLAVVLGILLGWIGLVIVLFLKPGAVEAARSTVSAVAAPTPVFMTPSVSMPTGSGRDAASRLAELEELRERGLITEGEYTARRTAILQEI